MSKFIFGQIWAQKVKVENCQTWYLKDADSYCDISFQISNPNFLFGQICMPTVCQHYFFECSTLNSFFGKFGSQKSKLFELSKSWHTWYLKDADSYFNICFLNFKLKIYFWRNLGQKIQICPLCLKIGTFVILRMRILIPRLVCKFSFVNSKYI